MKFLLKLGLGVLLVGATALIVAANFTHDPDFFQFKWKINAEPPLEVRLAEAAPSRIVRTVEAPGKVEADVEVKISAQVMGRILRLRDEGKDAPVLKEGDVVKAGQVVVQLDRAQFEADVRSGESRMGRLRRSIELAEAELEKTKRDFERVQRQYTRGAASQSEYADLQTKLHQDLARRLMAQEELAEATASLSKAKEDLDRTTIRAPMSGIVSQLMAKEGEVVVVGTMNNAGTVIMSISDPNTRVVRARVDENSVPLVREGQEAIVHFQNNAKLTLKGKVLRISPKGTKGSGTATAANDNEAAVFETIISLESPPPEVRLGMTASVEIVVETKDAPVSIPSQAVLHRRARDLPRSLVEQADQMSPRGPGVKDPTKRYHQVVFVADGSQARTRLVTTGISDENRVEVLAGLKPGDRVIYGPYRAFDKLKEGKAILEMADKGENE